MNLHRLLRERAATSGPIRVGIIGAGKFASMFLAQVRHLPAFHLLAIFDRQPARAKSALRLANLEVGASLPEALESGTTVVTEDVDSLIGATGMEVVIDATGDPSAGVAHALACFDAKRHVVMVNVEADVLAGPLLARLAHEAGVVYSLAYGDQPALIAELVDWARTAGFAVVCAGKGTKYLPAYHSATPDTVWQHYGLTPSQAEQGGMNPKMFNSFLDGTKSAIEMAAVANATGLEPPPKGLQFPPCEIAALPEVLKPRAAGGVLHDRETVEVVSSLERDGTPITRDLRWGVYVTFEAPSDYAARCFAEYGIVTDKSGRFAALYRPCHFIGLELGISVASVVLRGEPTGAACGFRADVVATAKRRLRTGETLDGEGGYTVWGRLLPADTSLEMGGLPIALAQGAVLKHPVEAGDPIRWQDVALDESAGAVQIRRRMESELKGSVAAKPTDPAD